MFCSISKIWNPNLQKQSTTNYINNSKINEYSTNIYFYNCNNWNVTRAMWCNYKINNRNKTVTLNIFKFGAIMKQHQIVNFSFTPKRQNDDVLFFIRRVYTVSIKQKQNILILSVISYHYLSRTKLKCITIYTFYVYSYIHI